MSDELKAAVHAACQEAARQMGTTELSWRTRGRK